MEQAASDWAPGEDAGSDRKRPDLGFLLAEKLGYAETSVLARSCYRWFEASPLQLRRQSAPSAKVAVGRG